MSQIRNRKALSVMMTEDEHAKIRFAMSVLREKEASKWARSVLLAEAAQVLGEEEPTTKVSQKEEEKVGKKPAGKAPKKVNAENLRKLTDAFSCVCERAINKVGATPAEVSTAGSTEIPIPRELDDEPGEEE